MKIILILKKKDGLITHHYPIDEKELSRTERETKRLEQEIIYKLFIKTSFSIQRIEGAEDNVSSCKSDI